MQATKPRTADEAVGRWPGILQSLGVDASFLRKKHGPCPICDGKDRYRFDDKEGRGTWICSHCGSGDGFRLLQHLKGWSFREAAKEVDRIVGTVPAGPIVKERDEDSKVRALTQVWNATRAVTHGDPVWRYLNRRLGLELVPADLRLHPALRYTDEDGKDLGRFPAMLARIRYPDGAGASIHRTYLTDDGQKAPVPQPKKIMAGKPLNTGCVRLGPAGATLGIAEGIETALAASQRVGGPVWAATNAVLLESWVPPVGVERVLIAGDNDASFTGQAAAFALARRLVQKGLAVEIQIPGYQQDAHQVGKDWADVGI
ncbi:primase-helicase zinc-binding domain-containing protein [[Empedobacter] haloabium]|uniref:Primase-helicase zinc-binding domain-containing protein n=1 Tax=[Empedobacter] haloabium TaxID=592317 RepID=A0ABZ1UQ83_9BURK